jgi:hypothetical protein
MIMIEWSTEGTAAKVTSESASPSFFMVVAVLLPGALRRVRLYKADAGPRK